MKKKEKQYNFIFKETIFIDNTPKTLGLIRPDVYSNEINIVFINGKKEIFEVPIFEYFHKYEYCFAELYEYIEDVEKFFNSFEKMKKEICLFIYTNKIGQNDFYETTENSDNINKMLYEFFIKDYALFF